jgi:NS3 serine protease
LPRGTFIYSRDITGATEGGSSGSPVLNASGQIVGQLYGACGFNLNDVCDAASNATVDGAFAGYYSQVSSFLTGGGPSCSASGASCSADSQCCSNNCKGKPGAKTCK